MQDAGSLRHSKSEHVLPSEKTGPHLQKRLRRRDTITGLRDAAVQDANRPSRIAKVQKSSTDHVVPQKEPTQRTKTLGPYQSLDRFCRRTSIGTGHLAERSPARLQHSEGRSIPKDSLQETGKGATFLDSSPLKDAARQPRHSKSKLDRDIELYGLDAGICKPEDFEKEVTRSFDPIDQALFQRGSMNDASSTAVSMSSTSTRWHGMVPSYAHELFRIHRAFTISMHTIVNNALRKQTSRNCCPNGLLSGNQSEPHQQVVHFQRRELLDRMALHLYNIRLVRDLVIQPSGMLGLYLLFVDSIHGLADDASDSAAVSLIHLNGQTGLDPNAPLERTGLDQNASLEAVCVPDYIYFDEFNQRPQPGDELVLVPSFRSNSPFWSNSQYTSIPATYSTDAAWLSWVQDGSYFKGKVPLMPDGNHQLVQGQQHGVAVDFTFRLEFSISGTVIQSLEGQRAPSPRVSLQKTVSVMFRLEVSSHTFPPILDCHGPEIFRGEDHLSQTAYGIRDQNDPHDAGKLPTISIPSLDTLQATIQGVEQTLLHDKSGEEAIFHLARMHSLAALKLSALARRHAEAQQECITIGTCLRSFATRPDEPKATSNSESYEAPQSGIQAANGLRRPLTPEQNETHLERECGLLTPESLAATVPLPNSPTITSNSVHGKYFRNFFDPLSGLNSEEKHLDTDNEEARSPSKSNDSSPTYPSAFLESAIDLRNDSRYYYQRSNNGKNKHSKASDYDLPETAYQIRSRIKKKGEECSTSANSGVRRRRTSSFSSIDSEHSHATADKEGGIAQQDSVARDDTQPRLSAEEEWQINEAKKRSMEEATAWKMRKAGISLDMDDIFLECSEGSGETATAESD